MPAASASDPGNYQEQAAWAKLSALTTNPLFAFVKQERNGIVHDRRSPSELHGERPLIYGFGTEREETVGVLDIATHYAFAPAFYNEVLTPAFALTRDLIVADAQLA